MLLILPLFALANSAIALDLGVLASDVSVGVATGLAIGKPVGILTFSLLAVWCFKATLMDRLCWPGIIGASCLAGIGFTMSIFITDLSLTGTLSDAGKGGTLMGSVIRCLLGFGILYRVLPASIIPAIASNQTCPADADLSSPTTGLEYFLPADDVRIDEVDSGQQQRDRAA